MLVLHDCETLDTLFNKRVLHAIFRPTSNRDPSTTVFNILKLNVFLNEKLIERIMKMSPVIEALPKSEPNLL